MPRSNASFLGQLLGTSQKITASALDDSVSASLGGSVTAYATAAALPLSGNTVGDQAYVSETGRLYIFTGAGWYNIALINTNPTITSGAAASYSLSNDGTPTIITLLANDPEGVPITWSYAVTTGSLSNGGGASATVTQVGNEFTITPTTTEAYAGDFDITFTASDGVNLATSASTFSLAWGTSVEYLVVAGGGAGGSDTVSAGGGGGGGAGGLINSTAVFIANSVYTITVGTGGVSNGNSGGTSGSGTNSVISGTGITTVTAIGGGGGGNCNQGAGASGGSGGGASGNSGSNAGSGTAGQGNAGAISSSGMGGGGGGAGTAGTTGGVGGTGLPSSITGTEVYYAGGGGGSNDGGGGAGGLGGGATGSAQTYGNDGGANTGGGGGAVGQDAAGAASRGGYGGSGIVILRYADTNPAATSTTGSPTITVAGGYRVYKFTQSGSITF